MSANSKIEWTEKTWNPIAAFLKRDITINGKIIPKGTRGWFCVKCSPGCANCYAEGINLRLGNGLEYLHRNLADIEFRLINLEDPLKWKKPCMVFVNSMTDLFLEHIPSGMIDQVFAVMAMAHRHTFQVLTKRAERMRDYCNGELLAGTINGRSWRIREAGHAMSIKIEDEVNFALPLRNVWLGVSVEDQTRADERIPLLLETPAAIRFLSVEPLLGPVDLSTWLPNPQADQDTTAFHNYEHKEDSLHWIIVGGESGPKARPCDVHWIGKIVAQCKAASVPVFVKQLGAEPGFNSYYTSGSFHHFDEKTGLSIKKLKDRKGGEPSEWPEDLRVREFPNHVNETTTARATGRA